MMCADSAFAILRAAASKGVMADGGSIVLMSSVAAHRGTAGMVAYSAGKGAIEAMVRSAAAELAPRRIRVNALAAGAFRSPMHDRITKRMPQAAQDAYSASHPLGFGSVEDVARAVLNLLDEPWTTGTVRIVDGGYLS
jgi:NAD(P)-dependent dehydrogenase (short-subunit alcohol dehydrogenase family)